MHPSELRAELQDRYETLVSMLRDVSDDLAEEVHREAAQLRVANEGLLAEIARLREELAESQRSAAHEREERERIEGINASLAAEVEQARGECVEFELSALRAELAHVYDRGTAAEREAVLRAQIIEMRGVGAAATECRRRPTLVSSRDARNKAALRGVTRIRDAVAEMTRALVVARAKLQKLRSARSARSAKR